MELVPCGECEACNMRKNSVYSRRVSEEIKSHRYSLFFTLTYDNKHLPRYEILKDRNGCLQVRPSGRLADVYNRVPLCCGARQSYDKRICLADSYFPRIENDPNTHHYGVCSKYDIQTFIKRLRQYVKKKTNQSIKSFRYFIASEYGPTTLRPHYHGIFFFDNEELLPALQAGIVNTWGLHRRVDGARNRFVFEPFADMSLTASEIKLCDANTSFYVAEYVNSKSLLPPCLRFADVRPFFLCSQSPYIGHYRTDASEMLEDVERGVVEHDILRVEPQEHTSEVVRIPYSQSDLCAVWRKCKGYRSMAFGTKLLVYGFVSERKGVYQRYLDEMMMYYGVSKPYDLYKIDSVYKFRNWCEMTSPELYAALEMHEDANWYASTYAAQMVDKFPIFRRCGLENPILEYVRLMDKAYMLKEQYKLRSFYDNLDEMVRMVGVSSVFSAYPFLVDALPHTYAMYLVRTPESVKRLIKSYGLLPTLYPIAPNGDRYLNVDYLDSVHECNTELFNSFVAVTLQKFQKKLKTKKQNNSTFHGHRRMA